MRQNGLVSLSQHVFHKQKREDDVFQLKTET
jgi:hypothetical protein